jgi:hypothetical protein
VSRLDRVLVCAVGALLAANAVADNSIHQWLGEPNDVFSYGNDSVLILRPGTFGFEALDPNGPNGLGYFQEIVVDPDCPSGTVNLSVARDPNEGGGPGATDVYYLELLNAPNVTVNIGEMRVTESLPDAAATATTGPVVADSIDSISLDYLGDDVECTTLGDVTVSEGLTGTPAIGVDGDYAGTMSFPDLPASAVVDITGTWSGTLSCSGDVAGDVSVYAVDESGWLDVTGTLSGGVRTSQDMLGSISAGELAGVIDCNRDFSGALYVGVCC